LHYFSCKLSLYSTHAVKAVIANPDISVASDKMFVATSIKAITFFLVVGDSKYNRLVLGRELYDMRTIQTDCGRIPIQY